MAIFPDNLFPSPHSEEEKCLTPLLSVHFINLVSVIFLDYVYISAGLDSQGLYIAMLLTCGMAKCLPYSIHPRKVLKASDSISDLER